jgi:hypothetical protein
MKNQLTLYASLFVTVALFFQCTPDDPPPSPNPFPILYKYERLDFQAPKLFILKATGSTEIPANSGSYLYYADEYLKEAIDIYESEFEIEKVELLDEKTAKVYTFDYLKIEPASVIVQYKLVGNEYQFEYDGELLMQMQRSADQNEVRICLKTTEHTRFNTLKNKVEHTPFWTDDICDEGNPAAAVEAQRTRWKLQPADTVLLNYSTWVYTKQ